MHMGATETDRGPNIVDFFQLGLTTPWLAMNELEGNSLSLTELRLKRAVRRQCKSI